VRDEFDTIIDDRRPGTIKWTTKDSIEAADESGLASAQPVASLDSPITAVRSPNVARSDTSYSARMPGRLYSDAVRVSSPGPAHGQESNVRNRSEAKVANTLGELSIAKSSELVRYETASESNMGNSEVEDDDDRPWTTVGRKSRLDQSKKNSGLTPDQRRVIFEAERSLTKKERDRLAERAKKVHVESLRPPMRHQTQSLRVKDHPRESK